VSYITSIDCANCGIQFGVDSDRVARLRETHETFYCPNGHRNHFPGKTKQEKRIEELEKDVKHYERWAQEADDERDKMFAFQQDALGALKACPLRCGWRSRKIASLWSGDEAYERGLFRIQADVIDHLCEEHNLELPAEAENWLTEVAR
jgi:hypothetical protein